MSLLMRCIIKINLGCSWRLGDSPPVQISWGQPPYSWGMSLLDNLWLDHVCSILRTFHRSLCSLCTRRLAKGSIFRTARWSTSSVWRKTTRSSSYTRYPSTWAAQLCTFFTTCLRSISLSLFIIITYSSLSLQFFLLLTNMIFSSVWNGTGTAPNRWSTSSTWKPERQRTESKLGPSTPPIISTPTRSLRTSLKLSWLTLLFPLGNDSFFFKLFSYIMDQQVCSEELHRQGHHVEHRRYRFHGKSFWDPPLSNWHPEWTGEQSKPNRTFPQNWTWSDLFQAFSSSWENNAPEAQPYYNQFDFPKVNPNYYGR